MTVLGVNKILKWCQVLSNGRRYTCQTKKVNGKLFFYFKKEWHSVEKYISEYANELVEISGKVITRPFREWLINNCVSIKESGGEIYGKKKYDDWERYDYENMVVELACGMETMDEDEYQEKFDSLPEEYQEQVRANELEFADGAVGDKSWRSDW